ncbi:hypothetical protein D3C81_2188290 [compost metagenome]
MLVGLDVISHLAQKIRNIGVAIGKTSGGHDLNVAHESPFFIRLPTMRLSQDG